MYQKVEDDVHTDWCAFSQRIDWVVENITGANNANGYIVQHFRRSVNPSFAFLQDDSYFEAWPVVDGNIPIRSEGTCDDEIRIGDLYNFDYDIKLSLGTSGTILINTDVYWIPQYSKLYDIVDMWQIESKRTNGLQCSGFFDELTDDYLVFSRPPIKHEWDLQSNEKIEYVLNRSNDQAYPNGSSRDKKLLERRLEYIFEDNPNYAELKKRLFDDWLIRHTEGLNT